MSLNKSQDENLNVDTLEKKYQQAVELMNSTKEDEILSAIPVFKDIAGYKDADALIQQCKERANIAKTIGIYGKAQELKQKGTVESLAEAIMLFQSILDWQDARSQMQECEERRNELLSKKESGANKRKTEKEQNEKVHERIEQAEQIRKKQDAVKNKKTVTVIAALSVCIVALMTFWFAYYAPLQKYNLALDLINREEYAEAASVLSKINTFKDSKEIQDTLLQKNESIIFYDVEPGDTVTFGSYEQDGNLENGKEVLDWIVLSNEDNRVTAICKNVIDVKPYNTANGEGSSLKLWLKEDFCNKALSVTDDYIKKVTLLTEEQREDYKELLAENTMWTPYSENNRSTNTGTDNSWWLNGDYYYENTDVNIQMDASESDGNSSVKKNVTGTAGVRPVLVIEYNHDTSNYYTDDEKDFQNAGKVTRTAEDIVYPQKYIGSSNDSYGTTNVIRRHICNSCGGLGHYNRHTYNKFDNYGKSYPKCRNCNGTGYIYQ